jgi:hypothetical protein
MMKQILTSLIFLCFLLTFSTDKVMAQKKDIYISSQVDSRFTFSAKRYFSTLGGSEEYWYYVKNNTSDVYKMVIDVTIDLACVGSKSYTLGVNKIVYIEANGFWDGFKSDWVHITNSGADNFKGCRLKDGDSYTLFKGLTYRISNIVNVTQEKAAADKKKADDAAKAAADKKKADDAAKATADKNKANTQTTAKSTGSSSSSSKSNSSSSSSTTEKPSAASKAADAETKRADDRAAAAAAKQAEDERKAAAAKAEQDRLNQKQADYDKWKADAKQQQSDNDLASAGAFGMAMVVLGGWIYDSHMGDCNPSFAYRSFENKAHFGMSIDFGYSLSSLPILFNSVNSTMTGGVSSTKKLVELKSPFTINFEPSIKIGVEHNNYGGFGYFNAKLGSSPIFDADNISIQYGGMVFAGLDWVKAYVDYGMGTRTFNKSSTDPEESGTGKTNLAFNKLEYGIRFTTAPKDDLRRSHIYLGMITENLTLQKPVAFIDPVLGTLSTKSQTPSIAGYTIQWNKEHTFKLYANFYPEYIVTGENSSSNGALSTDFKTTKTSTFFEFGFVRSINWWM